MASNGSLRIIGGRWRGRRLRVPQDARPTTDRLRETLFNWLMHDVEGAVCLDLFAGSGALGLEALSRGAREALFIDADRTAIQYLHQTFELLGIGEDVAHAFRATLPAGLRPLKQSYDLVFMDPPYRQDLLRPMCRWLQRNQVLAAGAQVYIEAERELALDFLPEQWQVVKQGAAGQVSYYLYRVE